jgi:uncharacterized iron-regulated membrane protein
MVFLLSEYLYVVRDMNKTLFKWHGYAGLFAFIPILLICLSGSILVFKYELDSLIRGDMVNVTNVTERLTTDELKNTINAAHPEYEISGWVLFQEEQRSDVVYLIKKGTSDWYHIYIDAYTGDILSPPSVATTYFTDWLVEFHASFLLDHTGLVITTFYAFFLMFLGISGLIIYRKFWLNLFKLRTNVRRILFFSDLHKLVGVYSTPIFLILGITGGYWNIAHIVHEYEEHANEPEFVMQGRLYNDDLSVDGLQKKAQARITEFEATYIRFPNDNKDHFAFFGDVHTRNPLISEYASSISFDRDNGDYISHLDIREASALTVVLDTFRRLHFGNFAGLISKILWCVAGITPLILTVTGLYMWFKRRKQRLAKKQRLAQKNALESQDDSLLSH